MNPVTASKLNRAKHATRRHYSDGRAERFVKLWDSKDYNKANFIGRVDPKTMDAVTELGLWAHYSPRFPDYAPDSAEEHWYLWEDEQ